MITALLVLQAIQVLFLWLHDWIAVPPLNDVDAVRAEDGRAKLARTTLIQSIPWTIGLIGSLGHARDGFPAWLWGWLWISYGLLFAGEIRAWWSPYLVEAEPERAVRYRRLSAGSGHSCPSGMAWCRTRAALRPACLHARHARRPRPGGAAALILAAAEE